MNPIPREIQLDTITRVIEGSGTIVDIKLPTQAQQKQGMPKGAANKPKKKLPEGLMTRMGRESTRQRMRNMNEN